MAKHKSIINDGTAKVNYAVVKTDKEITKTKIEVAGEIDGPNVRDITQEKIREANGEKAVEQKEIQE